MYWSPNLFFFGGCWLLSSCIYFQHFRLVTVLPICVVAGLLALLAWALQRSRTEPVLDGALSKQKKADDRSFAIVNAITYSAVFFLFLIFPKLGLQNYILPAFVALIGLHFFPMPPLYRHSANQVTGAFMVLWAIFCAIAFKADGNRVAAFVALGAGAALWSSSMWALLTARRLFQQAERNTKNTVPSSVAL